MYSYGWLRALVASPMHEENLRKFRRALNLTCAASVVLLELPFRPKCMVCISTKKWGPAIRGGFRLSAIWQSGEYGKFLWSVKFASPQDRSIFTHDLLSRPAGIALFCFFSKFDVFSMCTRSKFSILYTWVISSWLKQIINYDLLKIGSSDASREIIRIWTKKVTFCYSNIGKKGVHGWDWIRIRDVVIAFPHPDHRKSKFGLRPGIKLN